MTTEEIQQIMTLVKTHRATIRVYQRQVSIMQSSTPPYVIHGLNTARSEVARYKQSVSIPDDTCDFPTDQEKDLGAE